MFPSSKNQVKVLVYTGFKTNFNYAILVSLLLTLSICHTLFHPSILDFEKVNAKWEVENKLQKFIINNFWQVAVTPYWEAITKRSKVLPKFQILPTSFFIIHLTHHKKRASAPSKWTKLTDKYCKLQQSYYGNK